MSTVDSAIKIHHSLNHLPLAAVSLTHIADLPYSYSTPHPLQLYYYFVPIIITVLGSYFIASLFFDTYEMAVKTTFICFRELPCTETIVTGPQNT